MMIDRITITLLLFSSLVTSLKATERGASVTPSLRRRNFSESSIGNGLNHATDRAVGTMRAADFTQPQIEEFKNHLDQSKNLFQQEEGHRKTAAMNTAFSIMNTCHETANALVVYESSEGVQIKGWIPISPGQTTYVGQAVASEFFIFVYSENHQWEGDSMWCFPSGSPCLMDRDMGTGSSSYTFIVMCDSPEPDNKPVPAPTRAPSPQVPTQPLSEWEEAWVVAHNTRRTALHKSYDVAPINITWDFDLAARAQAYADELIAFDDCRIEHAYGAPHEYGGENLASNWGTGKWARPDTPEEVLTRWFDDEVEYHGGHFTQIAWRSTDFIGCAQAIKEDDTSWGGKSGCYIQVCRYIARGNCNMRYGWKSQMLSLDNRARCPPN